MMVNFYEVFCPTPEQIQEAKERCRKLHEELAVKRGCSTCKHCIHVRDYPDYVIGEECECDAGFVCDTVLFKVENCEKWEDDKEYENYWEDK